MKTLSVNVMNRTAVMREMRHGFKSLRPERLG